MASSCSSPESVRAARRASSGQVPPARSAIANSGRQLSAARSFRTSGTAGLKSSSLSKWSAVHIVAAWLVAAETLAGIAPAKALDLGVHRLALERDDDGTILKGMGEFPNGRDRLGRPSGEPPRLMLALDLNVADELAATLV